MKIIVLGGAGFIGVNLCVELFKKGHDVISIDLPFKKEYFMKNVKGVIEFIPGDFLKLQNSIDLFCDVDVVYHLISTTIPENSSNNLIYDLNTNVISSLRLLDICMKTSIKKIIFISSGGAVYGIPKYLPIDEEHQTNPLNSYGIGKLTIEKYIKYYKHMHNINYTILRVSNPYGPFQKPGLQGLISVLLDKAIKNKPIDVWGDGSAIRDYIYIEDLITAMTKALTVNNATLNIGTGKGYSILDIIKLTSIITNHEYAINYKNQRRIDVPTNILSIQKAKKLLDWSPATDIFDGISKFYKYYLRY